MEIKNQNEILVYAFRYALGRKTYSTSTVSNEIINNWDDISASDQKLYQREIKEAIKLGGAGMDCDVRNWERILNLPLKETTENSEPQKFLEGNLQYYEAKIICKGCKKELHIVEMEDRTTIEECPYCGWGNEVVGEKQTKKNSDSEILGGNKTKQSTQRC